MSKLTSNPPKSQTIPEKHQSFDIPHHVMEKPWKKHKQSMETATMSKLRSSLSKSLTTADKHSSLEKHKRSMEKDVIHHGVKSHHSHHHHNMRPKATSLPISNPDFDLVKSIYPFTMRDLSGRAVNLGKYEGHVCILVNVGSKSRFAEFNYKVLNKLYEKYHDSVGLRILAFPCDQFNHTEFSTNRDIRRFLDLKGVKFDVFSRISVNCKNSHPLWMYMKKAVPNTANKWRLAVITDPFTKFIVSRTGVPLVRLRTWAVKRQKKIARSYKTARSADRLTIRDRPGALRARASKHTYDALLGAFGQLAENRLGIKAPGASEEVICDALEPLFDPHTAVNVTKKISIVKTNIPPPIIEEDLPCMRSWHFEPGIRTLV